MYLKFKNLEAMKAWAETKTFKKNATIKDIDLCLFGSPSYFFVAAAPTHNLDDGEMNIHVDLLTYEEKEELLTLEEIIKS